jgi:hypothetical protein
MRPDAQAAKIFQSACGYLGSPNQLTAPMSASACAEVSATPKPEPPGVMPASVFTPLKLLAPVIKHSEATAFFELSGESAFGELLPVGRPQHEDLNEDEGVPAEPGNGAVLCRVKRLEWEQFRGARF